MTSDHGFVLIHGACLGGWVWERLVPRLGEPALAVDLPGRGSQPANPDHLTLDAAVADLAERLRDWSPSRVTLVGHSMGGIFALAVAAQMPERVAGLVFLSAAVPPDGKSLLSVMPAFQRVLLPILMRARPESLRPPERAVRRALCNDLDDETTAWVQARVVAEVPAYYRDPVRWGSLPFEVPRRYVKLLDDKSGFDVKRQERMIANLGTADVREIDSGHLPMLSRPDELAAVLEDRG
ncbi:MAG: alpha/beta fold hydrolase [Acidimicrobiia bacterium]